MYPQASSPPPSPSYLPRHDRRTEISHKLEFNHEGPKNSQSNGTYDDDLLEQITTNVYYKIYSLYVYA
jgi:hypothetical protein